MRAEIPKPSRQDLAPARDRLLTQINAPRGPLSAGSWGSWWSGRSGVRMAAAGGLSVALASGLIVSQTVSFGDGGGSGPPPATAQADEILRKAAAVAADKPTPGQGDFAYMKYRMMRQMPNGRAVALRESWVSVDNSAPGLEREKTRQGARQAHSIEPCRDGSLQALSAQQRRRLAKDLRKDLAQGLPESFRQKMQRQLPKPLTEMSYREICTARIDGKDFQLAAQQARFESWKERKIGPRHVQNQGPREAASLAQPTYEYLRSLPKDPEKLAELIAKQADAGKFGLGKFGLVAEVLGEHAVPPQTAAALFRAASRFESVDVRRDVKLLASGERGVAVTDKRGMSGKRTALIFDPESYEFLGFQDTLTRDKQEGPGTLEAGTVYDSFALLNQGIVDEVRQRP